MQRPPHASFLDQLVLEQGEIIFLNDGTLEDGNAFYLYLAVKGANVAKYFALTKSSNAPQLSDFEQVGTVIAFGEGTPNAELKKKLSDLYGVIH